MVRRKFLKLQNRFLNWIENVNPLDLFISLVLLRLLDIATALTVYHFRTDLFYELEQNVFLKDFLFLGNWVPAFLIEVGLLLLFVAIYVSIILAKRESEFSWRHSLSLSFIGLALAFVWSSPIAAGTNVISGMLLISGWLRFLGYYVFGIPIALYVMIKVLNIRNSKILVFLTIILPFFFFCFT